LNEELDKIFLSPPGKLVYDYIRKNRDWPDRVVFEGVLRYGVDEIHADDHRWLNDKGFKVEEFAPLFLYKESRKPLSGSESLDLYNKLLVPLWNYFIRVPPRQTAANKEETVIHKKGELATLMCLALKCLTLTELNPQGIILAPKVKNLPVR